MNKEPRWLDQGDGSWARILKNNLCPRCEVALDQDKRCKLCSWSWKGIRINSNGVHKPPTCTPLFDDEV